MHLRVFRAYSFFLLAVLVLAGQLSWGADPDAIWERIEAAGLDPEKAVAVDGLVLDMGMGSLGLEAGVLVPALPIEQGVGELVFIGQGRFMLVPPDPIEEAQLELFTEQTALDVPVTQAVLTVGNAEVVSRLLDRAQVTALDTEIEQRAVEAFGDWTGGAERRGFGADRALLGAALGDAAQQGFFAAWLRSEQLGDFYYVFDPSEVEQVTLGQFVPIEADLREEHRIRKYIEKQKRKGRYSRLRFEDLGDWDTWISAASVADTGEVVFGSMGIEPKHYTLDVSIDPKEGKLRGTARVDLRVEQGGRRLLPFSIFSDLSVTAARNADGEALPTFQSKGDVYVVLPEPIQAGQELSIEIDYGGIVLHELEQGTFVLIDTDSWYPRIGDLGRATYVATLRWPKRYELLASGRVVDSGVESNLRWERRTLDVPAIAFSFEVGGFDVHHDRVGHVDLTIGFSKATGEFHKGAKQDVIDTLKEALVFFEEKFGTYPLDTMTVATVPRGFSQGFLGFVTLSQYLIWTPAGNYWLVLEEDYRRRRDESRTETIAHELSHQWWGNLVGWASYRDQWLSEALADFSSVFFTAKQADRKSVYLARHAQDWRSSLGRTTKGGRTVESIGPVVLGSRLRSSHSSTAYASVVYDKGSVVFGMLARVLGEEEMAAMLKSLVEAVDNRVIDTATFIKSFERMTGLSLATFADQFIYGTGIPEIYYTYEFVPQSDGTWSVEGQARQMSPGQYRYRLEMTESETWHVARERMESQTASTSAFVVPFQVSLAQAKDVVEQRQAISRKVTTTERGLGGRMVIQGEVSDFRIALPEEPKSFWLDQRGEVLARFYCEAREPKRMLRYQAHELAGAGEFEQAEAMYARALSAPLIGEGVSDESLPKEKELERQARRQDALIHIGLARLYLEQERDEDARTALDTADGMLKGIDKDYFKMSRVVLRAHMDVHAGEYRAAYDALGKVLRLDFPVVEGETVADASRRNRFKTGRRYRGSGRAYALLAVTAFETGHDVVARQALKEAEKRGADMDAAEKAYGS